MNRELVIPGGSGTYPLQGDVQSTAGNANVTVIGIQNTPVESTTLDSGAFLEYNQNTNQWQPILRACIQCNGLTISDDYDISVNAVHVSLNGTAIA